MKKSTQQKYAALILSLVIMPALAVTSGPELRPQPQNFSSYSLYLQALFDYQRTQGRAPAIASSAVNQSTTTAENLEEAIANAGKSPGYIDVSTRPRSTFKSFSLAQIPTQDMEQNSVNDALGNFGDHSLKEPPSTNSRLRPDSDLSLVPDVSLRLISDAYDARWQETSNAVIDNFSGYILLPEGEAQASASVKKSTQGDSGIDLTLSAKVRSNVYIIDRDGLPGTQFDKAGVVAIKPLALEFSNIKSHITTYRNKNNDDLISIQSSSNNPITLDLSGSRFGTASAIGSTGSVALDRRHVGPVSYFAGFGEGAIATIAAGTQLDIKIGRPDGMKKALATVNGKVPDISVENFRLLRQQGEMGEEKIDLNIGKMKVSGLNMTNLRLFLNKKTIVIDMGTGIRNLSLSMEQIAIGHDIEKSVLGDLYIDNASINSSRISIAAH